MPPKPLATEIPSKIHHLPMTQARSHLGELVRRADLNREYFILEKDGIPIAGLMNIEEFEDYLELRDPKVQAQIQKSQRDYVAGKSQPAEILLEELKKEPQAKDVRRSKP